MRRVVAAALIAAFWAPQPGSAYQQIPASARQAERLARRGRPVQARQLLQEELEKARQKQDRLAEAWALVVLGRVGLLSHQFVKAQNAFEPAARLAAELRDVRLEGMAQLGLGIALRMLGQLPQAKEHLTIAAAKNQQVGSDLLTAMSLLELARSESRPQEKEKILAGGAEHAKRVRKLHLWGLILQAWSSSRLEEGDASGALEKIQEAVAFFERRGQEPALANCWIAMGRIYRFHGDHQRALEAFERALSASKRIQSPLWLSELKMELGLTHASLAHKQAALEQIHQAIGLARAGRSPYEMLTRLLGLAGALIELEEAAPAIALLRDIESRSFTNKPPALYWMLSSALYKSGRYEEAWRAAETAVTEARKLELVEPLWKSLSWRARAAWRLGRKTEAASDALEALALLEKARTRLVPADSLKRDFAEQYVELARGAVDWLHELGRSREALEVAEQARSRAFVDLLASRATAVLLNEAPEDDMTPVLVATGDDEESELLSTAYAPAATLQEMTEIARRFSSTAVIYWVNPEALSIWVVNEQGLAAAARRPIAAAKLEALVRQVAGRDASTSAAWRQLHRLLIDPIASALPKRPGARLTLAPHGPLFHLPFAALMDARGQYLVERFEIHALPAFAAARLSGAPSHEQTRFLLVGDAQQMASNDGKPLPALPGSRRELAVVAALLPKGAAHRLTGAQATVEQLFKEMADAKVLHFATHAVVEDAHPFASFLALSDGGKLKARDIYPLQLSADLAVLSACRSASGAVTADGVLGFTRAFFSAGVPSIIASVWNAADQATPLLFESFYRHYLRGHSKSASLRLAQLELLSRLREGKFTVQTPAGNAVIPEDPRLWSPFLLLGRP